MFDLSVFLNTGNIYLNRSCACRVLPCNLGATSSSSPKNVDQEGKWDIVHMITRTPTIDLG